MAACSGSNGAGSNPQASKAARAAAEAKFTSADSSLVKGVTPTALTVTTPRTINAQVPQIPLARNLSQALEVVRERTLRGADWTNASDVTITSQFLAVSSDVIGVEVRAAVKTGGKTTTTPTTLWYDATLSQTFSPSVLISWPGWDAFARAVAQEATAQGLDAAKARAALQDGAAPYGTGPAMGFGGGNTFILSFPPAVLAPDLVQVVLDAKVVTPLLSDYGTKALGASLHPSAFTGTPSTTAVWYKAPKDRPKPSSSPNLHPLPGDSTASPDESQNPTPASGSASSSPSPKSIPHPSTAVGIDCIVTKAVALTFDDGPGPQTDQVIAAFTKVKGAATFFQLGESIDQHPQFTVLAAASGFEVGNHTLSHVDLSTVSADTAQREIAGNNAKIKKLIGRNPMLLRPPYGDHNSSVDEVAGANNLAIINWIVDSQDWQTKNAAATKKKIFADVAIYTGPIILLHDIQPSTVTAVPEIVDTLAQQGYALVTVSELTLNTGGVKTAHGYCRTTALVQDGYLCKG
ncbi:MAG: polysaccharide deacetylase family protein [Acidipropionibacterium sp.]|jgi:peptidoglycan/xylan/chitin deacetylase (PgdA/CDA1 family)|nr:polysaccharide deacetylase family protein [Acidipropionibacterium sp.]